MQRKLKFCCFWPQIVKIKSRSLSELQIKMLIKQYYECTGVLSTGHNKRTKDLTLHSITDVLWEHAADLLTAGLLRVVAS